MASAKNWRTMRTPGVIDVFRVPKPGASFYQFAGLPGHPPGHHSRLLVGQRSPAGRELLFATNCDRLELSVNGSPLALITPDRATYPALAYPPALADLTGANAAAGTAPDAGLPDLRIDGYVTRRWSPRAHDRLHQRRPAPTDRSRRRDHRRRLDTTAITVRVADAYGNRRPGIAGDVTFTLTGPGTLIAANPLPLAALGGVGGGFIRSQPGQTGR